MEENVMDAKEKLSVLIYKAKVAQKQFESFSQEQVDACVKAIAKVVYDNAEMFAKTLKYLVVSGREKPENNAEEKRKNKSKNRNFYRYEERIDKFLAGGKKRFPAP